MQGTEWQTIYWSTKGEVMHEHDGWVGRVNLPNGKKGRLKEAFVSAEVAKGEVERRWVVERNKANGLD